MKAACHCTLVCDAPGAPILLQVELPDGPVSVAEVLELARNHALLRDAGIAWDQAPTGLWGRECARSTPVKAGDRVEIYRRLPLDPRLARRARATAARRAGGTVK